MKISTFERPFSELMKGMPEFSRTASSDEIAEMDLNILAEDTPLPCAVIKESALRCNEVWMQEFTRRAGVKLCPHGKTTMSPELFARQLAAGAWGITAATPHQLRVMRALGIPRILYANQLVGSAALRYVANELTRDAEFDFYCLLDSLANLKILAEAFTRAERPLNVLLEIGQTGGRTGVRNRDDALALARAVSRCPGVALAGLETYEFVVRASDEPEREKNIRRLFEDFVSLAEELESSGLFRTQDIVLSAGGSAYFDLAAEALTSVKFGRSVIPLIRSGCYLTYDHGWLPGHLERMRARSSVVRDVPGSPVPALEVWAYIQARPESGRAFATMGKRDVSFDIGFPQPLFWFRPGHHQRPQLLTDGTAIEALNDQHAYLRIPADSPLEVADMIGFGISHPCTTFDKWRSLLLVDDHYNVVGAISTWF